MPITQAEILAKRRSRIRAITKTGNGEPRNRGIGEPGNRGTGESGNWGIGESGNWEVLKLVSQFTSLIPCYPGYQTHYL